MTFSVNPENSKNMKYYFLTIVFLMLLISCKSKTQSQNVELQMTNAVNAPEINTQYGWLNTDKSYSIKDFRGKIVLLDFWTFGCINCQHIIPDLKKLEKEFANELVVIGIHSAKFDSEKNTQKIREAILKFGIEHPVVNDADYKVWDNYTANAWPTVALISPDGKVVFQRAGEGVYAAFEPKIKELVSVYDGKIRKDKIAFQLEKDKMPATVLKFPSKMISDKEGNIYFSDSGHNRVLKIDKNGKILETIGKGGEGFNDGDFQTVTFYEPHGLALKDNLLYIADTKNNAIRVADLVTKQVKTISGNGTPGNYYFNDKLNENVLPNSPWDLLPDGDYIYVANAGNHQILRLDTKTNQVYRFAGTGREALADGAVREAAFNQPSGLTKIGDDIYVADPEASAVRKLDLKTKTVKTVVGKGLFDFGDKDGDIEDALLQHCVGVTEKDGKIYIADTYNGKIKVLDLSKKRITTLVAGFSEPNDVLFTDNELWISDTNNNQLVKINLDTKEKKVVSVN
jgi:YVTN family beta-propeller protein